MQFIANGLNGEYLLDVLNNSFQSTKTIFAAIAYASSDPILFSKCRSRGIRLKFWGRYDRSVPVTTVILRKFLDANSPNYECKLVADIFHPKIIWWQGFGVYIGSANLTESGWFGNIEAGIFLTNEEIVENDLTIELIKFFEELDKKAFPLTTEVYEELCELEKENIKINKTIDNYDKKFSKKRIIPKLHPLPRITKKTSSERKKDAFIIEWNETLQILRNIADRVSNERYRPLWIKENVPKGAQADQFLHAFYFANVRKGTKSLHHDFHGRNRDDPETALVEVMKWWKACDKPPHSEDVMIYEWAEYLRDKLSKDKILKLTKDEFIGVCEKVHAMKDHSLRIKHTEFGFEKKLPTMNAEERIEMFGKWLYDNRSQTGKSALQTINYVLYEGEINNVPDRLWAAIDTHEWFFPHLGVSSLGEIVGWAMPNSFPPRNGRTSKALYALGYEVRIHSE